jgi:succinate dehydrogenase/fumarate reductase flavoprotein subunit
VIYQYNVVIVGGGIAGLYTALTAAVDSCRVAVGRLELQKLLFMHGSVSKAH